MVPFDWLQLGVAGGALSVLVALGRGFFKAQRDLMKHQEEQQESVLQFFGNHLTDVVDTQERVTQALTNLTNEIRAMRYELRSTGRINSKVDNE
ncbi:MAG TPA: hypothetical protein VJA25_11105 [Dehalococcoidia bacterium]|nr:hypothetical protein [Dehalococcoidia bacterium]